MARCLASLVDVVDEIVVVDTGSTDHSVAIAHESGAVVLHRQWDGDFSAARNFGLDAVSMPWVLYIDADEHLRPVNREQLHAEMVERDRHVSYRVWLQARHGFTPYREFRIWRNRPDIRFRGVIHESVTPDIASIAVADGLAIGDVSLYLEHEGYEGDLTAKHRRNLPLLQRQAVDDPDRIYLWGEIGRSHAGLGDMNQAIAAWQEGASRLRRNGASSTADCLVLVDLIAAHAESGQPDADRVAEADAIFPGNLLVLWAGTIDALAREDHAEVVRRLDLILHADIGRVGADAIALDQRIVGHWGYHARGMARFQLGDFAGAAADLATAESLAPDIEEYSVKRRLAEIRARP